MSNIFEVTFNDVKNLNDIQLTNILNKLLVLESDTFNIPTSCISGSMEITVGDGGEDASIKWDNGVTTTNWLPNRYTLFQCKATSLGPSGCKKEIYIKDGEAYRLKPRVKDVFESGGCYILFFTTACNKKQKDERIEAFREAIRQCGESYAESADIRIYDANSIASWINQFFSAIVSVCEFVGRGIPMGAQTWQQWSRYKEFREYNYVADDVYQSYINQLRTEFTGTRKIARIVGLSGLGKTRLALETFRPPESQEDIEQLILSSQVVYIDSSKINSELIPSLLIAWRSQKLRGTLIVDNCNLKLHNLLVSEIEHSENLLNLLTLDYSTEKDYEKYPIIELKPASDDVIKNIIEQGYPGLPDGDLNRIVEFAEGFPQMAVLLAEARLNELPEIGSLNNKTIMEKLLWGRGAADKEKLKVIASCAIFENIGFYEEKSDQRKFVADHICGIDNTSFYEIAQEFIEKGILDKTGRYVHVTPRPLAIRLAADWWKNCDPERAKKLILEDLPAGMTESLCNQMSKLHFLKEAQELTKDLCGNQSPFGQAEILNSEKGSRLFRSLVEVNPPETAKAIKHAFENYSTDELLKVGPGRRNLIWSLEKLCFWEDTFFDAAQVMLDFAAAENETWGNNATNQVTQLFQAFLSGTQAPPLKRLELIGYAFSKQQIEYDILAVKLLSQVLQTHNFTRMGGVELQGSRPSQNEWQPKKWDEVFNYWREGLKGLTSIAIGDNQVAALARVEISHRIRGLVQFGLMDELEESIMQISDKVNRYWPEALEAIRDAIQYEGPSIPDEGQSRLNRWLEYLTPNNLRERLRIMVSIPSWNYLKEEGGELIDISVIEAKNIAFECSEKFLELIDNLDVLLSGEQRQGYIFGFTIAEVVGVNNDFIAQCIKILEEITNPNPTVLGGYLAKIKESKAEIVREILNYFAESEKLYHLLINVTRLVKPDVEDLLRIIKLVEAEKIGIADFRAFTYGSVLSHLEPEAIILFTDKIIESTEEGYLVALDILHMYSLSNEKIQKSFIPQYTRIIGKTGILFSIENNNRLDSHTWKQITLFVLNNEPKDIELAKFIAEQIVDFCSIDEGFYRVDDTIKDVLRLMLQKYKDYVWDTFGDALLNKDNLTTNYHIRSIFEDGLILELPNEFIIKWCDANSDTAPDVICEVVPAIISNSEGFWFSPLIKYLLDKYGSRKDVRDSILRNLGPRSWSNSVIPYYEQQISAFESLLSHENILIRNWAQENIGYLKERIKKERIREEERDIGLY